MSTVIEPASTSSRTSTAVAGPVTFPSNRGIIASRARVPGTLRIAIVGDSMAYGAGVRFRRSLAMRLAAHLDGALPSVTAECLSFGIPGGCAFHAIGRVITQALPLQPDIVVLALCQNDALMLRPQPSCPTALGQSWLDFQPILRTALARFKAAAEQSGVRAVVVYHDKTGEIGGVSPPAEIARLCAACDLPFVDGSAALASYANVDLTVSVVDGHLNAFATDVVARAVAQFLVARQWLPSARPFSDAAWLEAVSDVAEARIDAGLPPAFAYGAALETLDTKWRHRKNTRRTQFASAYERVRGRLLDGQRATLARLALAQTGRSMRNAHPLVWLTKADQWTADVMAVSSALEHLAVTGRLDQTLDGFERLLAEVSTDPATPAKVSARYTALTGLAAAAREAAAAAQCSSQDVRHDCANLQYLRAWSSRVGQFCLAVEQCCAAVAGVMARMPSGALTPDAARLLAYVSGIAAALTPIVERARQEAARIVTAREQARRAAGAGWLLVELVLAADPGADMWALNLGAEGTSPAFTERHLACANIIRDGQPHRYEIEIPLMLAGDLHLWLSGPGISGKDALRLFPARIVWPDGNLPDVALPLPQLHDSGPNYLSLVYPGLTTIQLR